MHCCPYLRILFISYWEVSRNSWNWFELKLSMASTSFLFSANSWTIFFFDFLSDTEFGVYEMGVSLNRRSFSVLVNARIRVPGQSGESWNGKGSGIRGVTISTRPRCNPLSPDQEHPVHREKNNKPAYPVNSSDYLFFAGFRIHRFSIWRH